MLVQTPVKEQETKQGNPKSTRKNTSSNGTKSPVKNHGRRVKGKKARLSMPQIAPWKIILGVILLGGVGILYLHHVFATKKLLTRVQAMEQQYKQTKRSYKKYRMEYDRLTGPVEITQKAKKMGLIDGGPAKKIIKVKPE
jgi:hypothetical protein